MPWVPRPGTGHCGEKAALWSHFATHHARHLQLRFSLKAEKSQEAQSHPTSLKRGSKKTNKYVVGPCGRWKRASYLTEYTTTPNVGPSIAPPQTLSHKTRPISFFLKHETLAFSQAEIWGLKKRDKTVSLQLLQYQQKKHLPRTQTGTNPHGCARRGRWAADSSSGPAATTSGATVSETEVRSSGRSCLWAGRGRLPRLGGRAGMAATAAGAGAGAAQEKQFPPALLSFFIYNPRFGPREGEVSGAGPLAGVRGRQRARGRGAAG